MIESIQDLNFIFSFCMSTDKSISNGAKPDNQSADTKDAKPEVDDNEEEKQEEEESDNDDDDDDEEADSCSEGKSVDGNESDNSIQNANERLQFFL